MSASIGVLEQETLQPKILIITEICTNQLGERGGFYEDHNSIIRQCRIKCK